MVGDWRERTGRGPPGMPAKTGCNSTSKKVLSNALCHSTITRRQTASFSSGSLYLRAAPSRSRLRGDRLQSGSSRVRPALHLIWPAALNLAASIKLGHRWYHGAAGSARRLSAPAHCDSGLSNPDLSCPALRAKFWCTCLPPDNPIQ